MKDTINTRNNGLDVLKFLCAFFVICIHATFSWRDYIEPLTRVAVPVFFIISGYFSSDNVKPQRIKKIFRLLLIWSAIYAAWCFFTAYTKGISSKDLLDSWLTSDAFWELVLLNKVPMAGHLWYLSALLYVLVVIYVLKGCKKRLYRIAPILLCAALLLGTYSCFIFEENLPVMYSRNFLFTGLPFYLIGALIRDRENSWQAKHTSVKAILLLSILCTYLESLLLKRLRGYADADLYVSTIFLSVSLFLLFKEANYKSVIAKKISWWGNRCSLWIYLIHLMVLQVMPAIFDPIFIRLPISLTIYRHCTPFIALCLSTVIAVMIELLKERRRRA